MTVQQQLCARISSMSDEGTAFINQVINNMNLFLTRNENAKIHTDTIDVSKRIGIRKGNYRGA